MWGCKDHWFRLPKVIRDRIWLTYKAGQEVTKTPSPRYLVAARAAQLWIKLSDEYGDKLATEQFNKIIEEKRWPDDGHPQRTTKENE
jgi:hypothetical protein